MVCNFDRVILRAIFADILWPPPRGVSKCLPYLALPCRIFYVPGGKQRLNAKFGNGRQVKGHGQEQAFGVPPNAARETRALLNPFGQLKPMIVGQSSGHFSREEGRV